jgi:sugar lactone lactonase YvrE
MLPPAPVAYESQPGFGAAEDFAFDSLGNHVSVDDDGNLVRRKKTGEVSLWIASFANEPAGMVALPDDSVVVCDVENSALLRAYADGSMNVLLGGLEYPNGIDVGPDGFIYVAEDNGGRVLRVHPDTGVSTVVVEVTHPNGIAFTEDPTVFYVGSYNEGLIYKVLQPTPGQPGTWSVFVPPAAFESGGIDGMGVDQCGNVYAAEFETGYVYRITAGGAVTKIADLPSNWIPNVKWGRGVGGFAKHVLYVADREQGRLFGIDVNIEGVNEYFDL